MEDLFKKLGEITKPEKHSSIQMNTFRQELIDLYMQGWLDRDWRIGREEADEKAEMYADQIMKKYKL